MKVFFDTNVYVSEALTRGLSAAVLAATAEARWRIYYSDYVLGEVDRVLREYRQISARLVGLARRRIAGRGTLVPEPVSRHTVPQDAADGPILRAAIACGADWLVTSDRHLLALDPYEGLRILSTADYGAALVDAGLLPR